MSAGQRVCLAALATLASLAAAGCDSLQQYEARSTPYDDTRVFDLERMMNQRRYDPYEPSPYFANGMAMQHPPEGTVSRSQLVAPPAVTHGLSGGLPVEQVPVPVTAAVLERGRNRYDIFCAPCHGVAGDSDTPVARVMTLRPPPPLVTPPLRDIPPGRIYRAVAFGFGLMPSYAAKLDINDRWAVVAYVQALRLSQHARLDELPEELRQEAQTWLK